MSVDQIRSYRFFSQAQWDACLLAQVARDRAPSHDRLQPFSPFARQATLHESHGGHTPVVTRAREIFWCDDGRRLHWLSPDETQEEIFLAPSAIGRASRVVATWDGLWVMGGSLGSLQKYEPHSFTRLVTVNLPNVQLIDIASDGRDALLVLGRLDERLISLRIDRAGREQETVEFSGLADAVAFTYLRHAKRFVLLTSDPRKPNDNSGHNSHSRLHWFSVQGGTALFTMPVSAAHPCFEPIRNEGPIPRQALGSDSRERVFLAGQDEHGGGKTYVLLFDADGTFLGDIPIDSLDAPVTGLVGTRERIYVTGPRGLLRFEATRTVPEGIEPVRCTLITPMLHSPDREDQRRWLRIEATATLPEGSTIELSYAATDNVEIRDRLMTIAANESLTTAQRMSQLLNEPDVWQSPTVFQGAGTDSTTTDTMFSEKLFDVRTPYLWVCITMTAAAGARMPVLSELAVLYPGRTLMEHLPAIYQREESNANSFFRGLVGALETTTQGLDAKIGAIGRQIHPSTAPERWLDFTARWLGVPWDDGLRPEQKRAIMTRAAELTKWRGTRTGLEQLLECLMPGTPRRFRVIDATADFGFAVVGGDACAGSVLPAMLGGRTRWSAELGSDSMLGHMRLPCKGQRDDGVWHLVGRVQVDIVATASERKTWEPWLLALVKEMVPVTARAELRWVSAQALWTNRLDGTMVLASAPVAHLDTDAITGVARLPDGGIRLSASGSSISTTLQ